MTNGPAIKRQVIELHHFQPDISHNAAATFAFALLSVDGEIAGTRRLEFRLQTGFGALAPCWRGADGAKALKPA